MQPINVWSVPLYSNLKFMNGPQVRLMSRFPLLVHDDKSFLFSTKVVEMNTSFLLNLKNEPKWIWFPAYNVQSYFVILFWIWL